MAGAAAGVVLAEGGGAVAGAGGAEAILGKEAMSFFGKDPASALKIANFASENKISPQQITDMFHKLFGNNPGEPNGPEHHKDPAQSFINLFQQILGLANRAANLAEMAKSKLPDPTKMSMKPEPTAPSHKDEEKEKQEHETATARKKLGPRPKGF